MAVSVERAEEVEREACGVDVGDKKRLVVFLSSKDVIHEEAGRDPDADDR